MLNLLLDFDELRARLLEELRAPAPGASPVDAFLLAAGMNQILEDHLHRDLWSLSKVARRAPEILNAQGGRAAAATALAARSAGLAVRDRSPRERGLIAWQPELAGLVAELARAVAAAAPTDSQTSRRADRLLAPPRPPPAALRRTVVRLGHCFRSFDQRIDDCRRLAELVAEREPLQRPFLVVGLRTSGSYLAPLCAAFLAAAGAPDVEVVTMRPGQRWLAHERARLARAVAAGSLACVVDDPPRSGTQLALAARELAGAGFPAASILLLVALLGPPESLPDALREHRVVALPWAEWSVHAALAPAAVGRTLRRVLGERGLGDVVAAEAVGPSPAARPPKRGHVDAVYRVALADGRSGAPVERAVAVSGAGVGYLGAHAKAVADALADRLPEIYALEDGLLYRAWLPDEWRLDAATPQEAESMAAYVLARRRALAVGEDVSRRLAGRGAAWEVVAAMLADAFGRAGYAVRPFANHAARRLLRTDQPSIVDASMSPAHWFRTPRGLLKVGFATHDFSNHDLYCYDAVFDLAGAAAADGRDAFVEPLRRAFERLAGKAVPDERWLLYQLLHHHTARAGDAAGELARERAMARAHQRYFERRYFADLPIPRRGRLCGIDVDWVLETRWLGFPAIAPAGALALRALARHGFRPVLATGRSLPELRDRCSAYHLAGGVAEYGSVLYDHGAGRSRSLLTRGDREALEALRAALAGTAGIGLHPAYEHAVRAFRTDGSEHRRGLTAEQIEAALARTGAPERFAVVPAASQTDFTLAHVDKGSGLRALAGELPDAQREPLLAFAMGDTAADLPMLRLAESPFAPAGAEAAVTADGSLRVVARPFQAGLLLAVSAFLEHAPSRCAVCRVPGPTAPDARLLLGVLSGLAGGRRETALAAGRLAARVAASVAGERVRGVRRSVAL